MTSALNLRSLRVFFATLTLICLPFVGRSVFAQPIIEGEDITKASKELRRILYERYEIQNHLKELQEEEQHLKRRIDELNGLISLQKELDQLWEKIEAQEENGEKAIAELEERAEKLEIRIEHQRDLADLRGELREWKSIVVRLQREDDNELAVRIATRLNKTTDQFERMLQLKQKLHDIYNAGPESAEADLEEQLEHLEGQIELDRELVGLVEELFEAFEEEDSELVEELVKEIQGFDRDEPTEEESETTIDPALLPIPVNDEALARYANRDFQKTVVPILKKYCIDCHGNDSSSGDLNIQQMLLEQPIVVNRHRWINVIEQSKNRVMPPEEETQPSESERTELVLTLHNAIYSFDYSKVDDPGYETTRRLTHQEYDNTSRDLFGVDVRRAQQFPADLTGTSGFDNSANTLFLQPLLMERYMGAADEIVASFLPAQLETDQHRLAHSNVFFDEPKTPGDEGIVATKVLRRFLSRAYRRPPSSAELQRSLAEFRKARDQGLGYHESIKGILRATLISPNFLLRSEIRQDSDEAYRISDWEMASRLSYFIWASMPDEELFQLASTAELSNPEILAAQVKRMIDDPKSETLGSIFAAQWLGSQHLGTRMRLDPIDNPWCTESLMAAMRQETSMFFHTLVREDRPIQELVEADYTFLNQELAKHYRIPGVRGEQMRRVKLKTDRRGGILGHGSLLAVTSFPYRTSPVVRGKWILDTVLGTPPPPPPPNVSEFSDEVEENERLSIRQKLELHRKSPNCYACHSQMDPLGLSLENYDWFGRWREKYGRRSKIDNEGMLPNGTQFNGLPGLKKVVIEQRFNDLVRQLTVKMLSYALGRQLEYYDEPSIRKIVAEVGQDDYRFRALIHHIVMSYPFQYKKNRNETAARQTGEQHE